MKNVLKKSLGMILIDVGFIVLVALPPVRQAGVSLVLFGVCLAIMTVLSMAKNLKEVKNGEQEQGESLVMKVFYYIGIALAVIGFALLILRKLM